MWQGDYWFLLTNLIKKDFKVRYRNMSLGVFWSLLNPLVNMGVLTFIFTKIFPPTGQPDFPVFVLCGLVPHSFFVMAWGTGTSSLIDNTGIIKRVPVPRDVIPISTVLGNVPHLLVQIALLLSFTVSFGRPVTIHWLWLPVIWGLEVIFVCGLSLITSAVNVFIRDTRYAVESLNTILFWLVPIFYSFTLVPQQYRSLYQYNPVAAVVLLLRNILLEGVAPLGSTMSKLAAVSFVSLAIGLFVFHRLKPRFYNYL